jgi:hypothetical protein
LPEHDKYAPGKPRSSELPERVAEMQRFLARVSRYVIHHKMTQRAAAYAIWYEFEAKYVPLGIELAVRWAKEEGTYEPDKTEEKGASEARIRRRRRSKREKPPGPLIPQFETRGGVDIAEVRRDCDHYLRGRMHRPATDIEIAVEVASRFTEDDARAAVRKLQRLVAEAQRTEYVHLGVDIDNYFDANGALILSVRKRQSAKRPLPPARR